ncbi:het domain-containing protein [Ophiostoma piceae UAMH 11346]|uniref:Het domain-containing protein n=1 Tax=Ophiostoma piceae (strain UAMH 11346) TaxID=1262450 RepID=S3DBG4_OPHP1|nr:het domain-containing protein [Ophiostoma piceae UAMH 11346]
MRLINANTLELVERFPPYIPQYAILSHRWGEDEVSFQDYLKNKGGDKSAAKKIRRMADITKNKLRYDYFWIDTCCINKTDSSELSESINSMYQWYRDSAVCIAYLADVIHEEVMMNSEWFDRGWTLQELVAPRRLFFYDASWKYIGDKVKFVDAIFKKTNVPRRILANQAEPSQYSLARRMSWAAGRTTTRVEDVAYSLLGIFGVNMPLLYGEGRNSFRRLQEEIVKHSSDLTIFAWRVPGRRDSFPQLQVNGVPTRDTPSGYSKKKTVVFAESKPGPFADTSGSRPRPASPVTPPSTRSTRSRSNSADRRGIMAAPMHTDSILSPSPSQTEMPPPPTPPSTAPSTVSVAESMMSGHTENGHTEQKHNEMCLFATSPDLFSDNASLHPFADDFENFTVTNRGLFVSGSVYLRLVHRPAPNENTPSTNHYLLLVGSQFGTFIGIYLIKIGPNLFQRDWGSDMAVLAQTDVQLMRGFLVTDWYILIDKRPGNTITPEIFRQFSIHVPSQGLCNKYVMLKDTAPTHLWDVQDRLFVRPKAYAWTRYDMVLSMKCAVALRDTNYTTPGNDVLPSKRVNFVVMCHYRVHQEKPKFVMFLESDYPKEAEMLMVRRAPNNSLMWADLEVICPKLTQLPDNVLVDVGSEAKSCWYRISLEVKAGKVTLEYSNPSLFSMFFDIKLVEPV